jgi:8-oxo-dGTP diphosphatase
MEDAVYKFYGNRLRVRSCGLLVEDGSILLANHLGLTDNSFWAPPGGGIEWGENAKECLKREWLEETGLMVEVCDFLFACEFINSKLHAIELFFEVHRLGGHLKLGSDPEPGAPKVLSDLKFFDQKMLMQLDRSQRHGIFTLSSNPQEILDFRGYLKL